MKPILLALGLLALAGCQPTDPAEPQINPAKKTACEAEGGTYARGGLYPDYICFRPTPDGGKSCRKATDCYDTCLADTQTCNKVSPMFGCYSYLDEDGKQVEICVD